MPRLYEYFGLIISFFSNDHEPIHVHCQYAEYSCKAELHYDKKTGKLRVVIKNLGKKALPERVKRDVIALVEKYHKDIVFKWTLYMSESHIKPKIEKITTKL